MRKVKRKFLISVIFSLIVLALFTSEKKLLITNLRNFPISENYRHDLVKAYFSFPNNKKYDISVKEIQEHFKHCDDIQLLDSVEGKWTMFGPDRPLFQTYKVKHLFLIALVENATVAGTESVSNKIYYLRAPFCWIKVRKIGTGLA